MNKSEFMELHIQENQRICCFYEDKFLLLREKAKMQDRTQVEENQQVAVSTQT